MIDFKKILSSPKAVLAAAGLALLPSCTMPSGPGYGNGYGAQRQNGYSQSGGFGNPTMPNTGVSSYAQQRAEYSSLTRAKSRARKAGDYRTEADITYRQEQLREQMRDSRYYESRKNRTERTIRAAPNKLIEKAANTTINELSKGFSSVIKDAL